MTSRLQVLLVACAGVLAVLVSGCGSSGDAQPSSSAASLSLVGLGDSVPGALGCTLPCRSYVRSYGEEASKALGEEVTVTNLATNDSLVSGTLLYRVSEDQAHRDALAKADLVTLTIGFNDWQADCYFDGADSCMRRTSQTVENNLGQILTEIAALRAGKPTAIRVTTYYNGNIGNPNSPSDWSYGPADEAAFQALFAGALADFNTMICRVAEAASAVCVDLVPAFNGPNRDQDAKDLLLSDHGHPSEAGHLLIADSIAASGFDPLS